MRNRLYRSRTDAVIGGVCGGLGQYLGIDPTWVRIFFILLAISQGAGVLIYLILWFVIPVEGSGQFASSDTIRAGAEELASRARSLGGDLGTNRPFSNPQAGIWIGAGLVILGGFLFVQALGLPFLRWVNLDVLWPVLLVLAGLVLIWRQFKGD